MDKKNIVKYKKKRFFNIGFVIYGVIFIYILFSLVEYMSKENTPLFEAELNSMMDVEDFTGIIIRDEEVIESTQDGYIRFLFREGEKAARDSVIAIMSNDEFQRSNTTKNLDENVYEKLREKSNVYVKQYDTKNFDSIYDFVYDYNNILIEHHQTGVEETQNIVQSEDMTIIKNMNSGIISYLFDGLESMTPDKVTLEVIKDEQTNAYQTLDKNYFEKGENIYRVINSQKWSIVFPATEKLLDYIEGSKKSLTIQCMDTNQKLTGTIKDIFNNEGTTFVELEFDGMLSKYISNRFINFEIIYSDSKGIKIPNSAITTKELILLPKQNVSSKGSQKGVMKTNDLELESTNATFVALDLYDYSDNYYAIVGGDVEINDTILIMETNEEYVLKETELFKGVYNANRGYCIFKFIEEIEMDINSDYTIVKGDTPYGIRNFDYIVLDQESVEENQLIY